jgi:nucleotide-binding universal stress UspA family protein
LLVRAEAVEVSVVDHQHQPAGHGEEPGADIARHLARHGAQVEVRRMSSGGQDVGHLLLSRAAAFHADLLVMGAYGHSHLREWMFGGVTRTVLYEAGLPVLMSR